MNEFYEMFEQYKGMEFTYDNINYYMHMYDGVFGIDVKKESEWDCNFYTFSSLEEMLNKEIFNGKSVKYLIENKLLKDEWYS